MLVLTRKTQERIEIGSGITVTVLRIKGKSVRLGIAAPKDCNILRGELSAAPASESSASRSPGTHHSNQSDWNRESPLRSRMHTREMETVIRG